MLNEEQKRQAINDIIHFFAVERDEEIGQIAATSVLDFFMNEIGTVVYNKGLQDAKAALETRIEELNYDLDDLQKT